jgi:hypothetical protein
MEMTFFIILSGIALALIGFVLGPRCSGCKPGSFQYIGSAVICGTGLAVIFISVLMIICIN